jgi:L-asparaginase
VAVLLVACGGTIASRARPDGTGVAVALTGEELLDAVGIDRAGLDVVDAAHGPSWSIGPDAALAIARTVVGAADAGTHDGIVVTHGTDTVEETMFLTWLVGGAAASERCPIVFTAAMRHDGHPEADGPTNLRHAIASAASGARPGPLLAFDGAEHHARWVTKTDAGSLDTFRSVGAGAPTAPPAPPPHGADVVAAVGQVHAHTGVDPDLVSWHVGRGVRGLVVEGTGSGNVHGDLVPGIEAAIGAGVPVVVTTRCWTGAVAPVYGGPGGGAELAAIGCIPGGDLPTHKARVALSVALGRDPAPAAVRTWFAQLLGGRG